MNLKGLRIDFLAGTLGCGGAERQLYYTLKILSQEGVQPRVLSLDRGGYYEKKIIELGIPVCYVGKSSSRMVRLLAIIRQLRDNPPRIIQSVHFYTNIYAALSARIVGVWEVGAVRNDLAYELKGAGIFGNWCLRFPRALIVNSRRAFNQALTQGVKNNSIYLLGNGIDTDLFSPRHKKAPLDTYNSKVCLAYVGSLSRAAKRADIFLKVLAKIIQLNPCVYGILAGEGILRASLEELALGLGLKKKEVIFKGFSSDISKIYSEADVLVLTSEFEGMPNVVLEAMACGVPVVSFDVGGVGDIIQHGVSGYLAQPGNTNEIIGYILRLVSSPRLRSDIGIQARTVIQKHFSLALLRQNIIKFNKEFLGRVYGGKNCA